MRTLPATHSFTPDGAGAVCYVFAKPGARTKKPLHDMLRWVFGEVTCRSCRARQLKIQGVA